MGISARRLHRIVGGQKTDESTNARGTLYSKNWTVKWKLGERRATSARSKMPGRLRILAGSSSNEKKATEGMLEGRGKEEGNVLQIGAGEVLLHN